MVLQSFVGANAQMAVAVKACAEDELELPSWQERQAFCDMIAIGSRGLAQFARGYVAASPVLVTTFASNFKPGRPRTCKP